MADLFQVSIQGAQAVANRIASLGPKLREAERRTVFRASQLMAKTWVRNVSGPILKRRTGAYAASVNATLPVEVEGAFESRVGARQGVPYAKIHETGGVIRAKNFPYLKFRIDGHWFSKREVTIPARRPMGQSFDEVRPLIPRIAAEERDRAVRAVLGV